VQNFLYGLVMNYTSLPVEYVLFTALESKTEDDDRSTIYGPAISGKKGTAQCGAWFGDLIHAQDYPIARKLMVPDPKDPSKKIEQDVVDLTVRYHFKKHLDPSTGIPFPAKPRVTPEKIAELEKRFAGGYFEPGPAQDDQNGFDAYLMELDRLAVGQADTLKGWRERMDEKLGRAKVAVSK
jgi:hypothetical protein